MMCVFFFEFLGFWNEGTDLFGCLDSFRLDIKIYRMLIVKKVIWNRKCEVDICIKGMRRVLKIVRRKFVE